LPGASFDATKNVEVLSDTTKTKIAVGVAQAGKPTYDAVQSQWDDAGNWSEPESEDEEMDVS
jgi:hypothetical protein